MRQDRICDVHSFPQIEFSNGIHLSCLREDLWLSHSLTVFAATDRPFNLWNKTDINLKLLCNLSFRNNQRSLSLWWSTLIILLLCFCVMSTYPTTHLLTVELSDLTVQKRMVSEWSKSYWIWKMGYKRFRRSVVLLTELFKITFTWLWFSQDECLPFHLF